QALPLDLEQAAEARMAVAVKLFGVGKGTLHSLLAAPVDRLAPPGEPPRVGPLARVLPDMASDRAFRLRIARTRGQQRTFPAKGGIGFVMAVAGAVRRGVGEKLPLRTTIAILSALVDEPG